MFKEGDLVIFNEKGKEKYSHETNNPHNQIGLAVDDDSAEWYNDKNSVYEGYLDVVTSIPDEYIILCNKDEFTSELEKILKENGIFTPVYFPSNMTGIAIKEGKYINYINMSSEKIPTDITCISYEFFPQLMKLEEEKKITLDNNYIFEPKNQEERDELKNVIFPRINLSETYDHEEIFTRKYIRFGRGNYGSSNGEYSHFFESISLEDFKKKFFPEMLGEKLSELTYELSEFKAFKDKKALEAVAAVQYEANERAETLAAISHKLSCISRQLSADASMLDIFLEEKELIAFDELNEVIKMKLSALEDVFQDLVPVIKALKLEKTSTKVSMEDVKKSLGL